MPGLCGRKGNLGLLAQTKPNRKMGRSSWRFASREVASALFVTLGSKGQFSFLPSADSDHHLARFSTSPLPIFFLPLGSGCPASSGGQNDVAFVFGEKFPFLVFVYFCLKTFLVPIVSASL